MTGALPVDAEHVSDPDCPGGHDAFAGHRAPNRRHLYTDQARLKQQLANGSRGETMRVMLTSYELEVEPVTVGGAERAARWG